MSSFSQISFANVIASVLNFCLMLDNYSPYSCSCWLDNSLSEVLKFICCFFINGGQNNGAYAGGLPRPCDILLIPASNNRSGASSYVLILDKSSEWMEIILVHLSGISFLPLLDIYGCSSSAFSLFELSESKSSPSSYISSRIYCCMRLVRTFLCLSILIYIVISFISTG